MAIAGSFFTNVLQLFANGIRSAKLCRDPERQIAARRIDVGHVPQMRATAEPHCGPAVGNAFNSYLLDDPEKPKDQDQDQQATETDIHLFLPFLLSGPTAG
jgi:hypothetical protein